jgi:hypothetical protein
MPAESSIVVEGKITAVLPGTMFRVELSNNHLVLAHLGKDEKTVYSFDRRGSSKDADVSLRCH